MLLWHAVDLLFDFIQEGRHDEACHAIIMSVLSHLTE
jgi:hypothetical protein